MAHYLVRILNEGDRVVGILDGRIAVRRANGEVDILRLIQDNDGAPRIDTSATITITYGPGDIVVASKRRPARASALPKQARKAQRRPKAPANEEQEDDIVFGTF
jgi:hypothetical protein